MPFWKDDKETADHMIRVVTHFTEGKGHEQFRYASEFADLDDVRKNTCDTLSELTDNFIGKSPSQLSEEHIPFAMSEASMHVAVLDCIAMATAKSTQNEK
ncbi:MAG: hypothetical protein U0U46_05635 [Saprospiraceae bacterium]